MENYTNQQPPEGINVSKEHPLKDFFILLFGICATAIVFVLVLTLLSEQLVRFIPFETEALLADKFIVNEFNPDAKNAEHKKIEQYLQKLGNSLLEKQDFPREMKITMHYVDDETINAFATLGGHIIVHRGLLEKMPNENTLAMVIAHEIAHIKYRHPVMAMGRGITIAVAFASLAGITDSNIFNQLIGDIGMITALSFSRHNEEVADSSALKALLSYYGHTEGASTLFSILAKTQDSLRVPEFLSTHPLSKDRIDAIRDFQNKHNRNKQAHRLISMPDFISNPISQ